MFIPSVIAISTFLTSIPENYPYFQSTHLVELEHSTMESNFHNLPITEVEKKIIYKLITTMSDKKPLMLAFEKKSLEKKGKRIHHVHPFRFLGYVFNDKRLKESMREIKKSYFKWNGFIDGFAKKMRDEASHNNLMPYVPTFADFVHADRDLVARYIQKHDYDGLVKFLINL